MKIADIGPNATLITDSQDVRSILIELGIDDDDYGGIFLRDNKAYGFLGCIPYLDKTLFYLGELDN
jgi:hypothetical protein